MNAYTFEGQTALWIAADNNSLEAARVLLEAGGLVNLPNNEDVTPLHCGILTCYITSIFRKYQSNLHPSTFSCFQRIHRDD